jgi:CelD/BcsL family acetyltransferase involved in cellulose biosynthesis
MPNSTARVTRLRSGTERITMPRTRSMMADRIAQPRSSEIANAPTSLTTPVTTRKIPSTTISASRLSPGRRRHTNPATKATTPTIALSARGSDSPTIALTSSKRPAMSR